MTQIHPVEVPLDALGAYSVSRGILLALGPSLLKCPTCKALVVRMKLIDLRCSLQSATNSFSFVRVSITWVAMGIPDENKFKIDDMIYVAILLFATQWPHLRQLTEVLRIEIA